MNRNSSHLWLPKIEAAGLPTPKTLVIPYCHSDCVSIFDGESSEEFNRLIQVVRTAAGNVGYPVFIRTDLSSAKHSGPSAFRIDDPDGVADVLARTIEDNEMKFWMELEREGPTAILVREFLNLESPFQAFHGLAISREWRYFSDGQRVLCKHPYWPADAIEGHVIEKNYPEWRTALADLHNICEPDQYVSLGVKAIQAAHACRPGSWSVDFCRDTSGRWWLLDMAAMEDSYHWPGCPNGKGKLVNG